MRVKAPAAVLRDEARGSDAVSCRYANGTGWEVDAIVLNRADVKRVGSSISSESPRCSPRGAVTWLFALVTFWSVSACDEQKPAPVARPPLRVFATVYPVADLARNVGGGLVQVDWAIEIGQRPQSVAITPDIRQKLSLADAVLSNGLDEPWAIAGFDDVSQASRLVRLDSLPSTRGHPVGGYLWLDPTVARECVAEFANRLALFRPEHADLCKRNAERTNAAIDALLEEMMPRLRAAAPSRVVTLSRDFTPLLRRLGIREVRPVEIDVPWIGDDEARAIRAGAREGAVDFMVISADLPPAVARDWAERTGLKIITLDAMGSSAETGRHTYLELMRYNLRQLAGETE